MRSREVNSIARRQLKLNHTAPQTEAKSQSTNCSSNDVCLQRLQALRLKCLSPHNNPWDECASSHFRQEEMEASRTDSLPRQLFPWLDRPTSCFHASRSWFSCLSLNSGILSIPIITIYGKKKIPNSLTSPYPHSLSTKWLHTSCHHTPTSRTHADLELSFVQWECGKSDDDLASSTDPKKPCMLPLLGALPQPCE